MKNEEDIEREIDAEFSSDDYEQDESIREEPSNSGNGEIQHVDVELNLMNSGMKNLTKIDEGFQNDLDREWDIFDKITDYRNYRNVKRFKGDLIKLSGEYRIKYMDNILNGRLEAVQERLDAGLTMVKSHYREKVASHLLAKMEELSLKVHQHMRNFFNEQIRRYRFAETLKGTPSYENYYNSLTEFEIRYLNFNNKLLINFENSIENIVKKYKS